MIGRPEPCYMVDVVIPADQPDLLDRLVADLPVQFIYITSSVSDTDTREKVAAVVRFTGSQEEILEVQRRAEMS